MSNIFARGTARALMLALVLTAPSVHATDAFLQAGYVDAELQEEDLEVDLGGIDVSGQVTFESGWLVHARHRTWRGTIPFFVDLDLDIRETDIGAGYAFAVADAGSLALFAGRRDAELEISAQDSSMSLPRDGTYVGAEYTYRMEHDIEIWLELRRRRDHYESEDWDGTIETTDVYTSTRRVGVSRRWGHWGVAASWLQQQDDAVEIEGYQLDLRYHF